jgi:hypothetical protein
MRKLGCLRLSRAPIVVTEHLMLPCVRTYMSACRVIYVRHSPTEMRAVAFQNS